MSIFFTCKIAVLGFWCFFQHIRDQALQEAFSSVGVVNPKIFKVNVFTLELFKPRLSNLLPANISDYFSFFVFDT